MIIFSCYGKSIQNVDSYKDVRVASRRELDSLMSDPFYDTVDDLDEEFCEVTFRRRKILHNRNTKFGWCVYSYAKLAILRLYYDFFTYFFDTKDFEPVLMDTDSIYMAFSSEDWESLVKPELAEQYAAERHLWLPYDPALNFPAPPPDQICDNRTPGLFHIEFKGDLICALNPKTYYAEGQHGEQKVVKTSTKGLPKRQNSFIKEQFVDVLSSGQSVAGQVRNFRFDKDGKFCRMNLQRTGLSYLMIKRKVQDDGISTVPLMI